MSSVLRITKIIGGDAVVWDPIDVFDGIRYLFFSIDDERPTHYWFDPFTTRDIVGDENAELEDFYPSISTDGMFELGMKILGYPI